MMNLLVPLWHTVSPWTGMFLSSALADTDLGGSDEIDLPHEVGGGDVRDIVIDILRTVLSFVALLAVIVIIIAGIVLIVSGGNDERKDQAKKMILYAIIGLIIIILANIIVSLVVALFS